MKIFMKFHRESGIQKTETPLSLFFSTGRTALEGPRKPVSGTPGCHRPCPTFLFMPRRRDVTGSLLSKSAAGRRDRHMRYISRSWRFSLHGYRSNPQTYIESVLSIKFTGSRGTRRDKSMERDYVSELVKGGHTRRSVAFCKIYI